MEVQSIYVRRLLPDLQFRNKMWKILCCDFFQRYVEENSRLLEIGAGYCEFINNIHAGSKTAVDINPDVKIHAAPGVKIVLEDATQMSAVPDNSIDMVFASNFFEHLSRDEIMATFKEVYRILVPGGKFMVLQPNIRFCSKDYWMFFDHITPIDDRAFVEGLEINRFKISEVIVRFLPYSTKGHLPKALLLIRLYLLIRPAWRFLGQQSFILSYKPINAN